MFKRIVPLMALLVVVACAGVQGGNRHTCPCVKTGHCICHKEAECPCCAGEDCQCNEEGCVHCHEAHGKDAKPCPVCLDDKAGAHSAH